MKGLERIILYVFLTIVGIILLYAVLRSLFVYNPENTSTSIISPTIDSNDKFDYTSYILSSSPIDLSTYDECKNLKNAIKYAIITGKPYKVEELAYGNDLSSSINFPFIGDCPEEDIEIPIGIGINQTVCRFKPISNNPVVSASSGGISDAAFLDFDNCIHYYNQYYTLPLFNLGPKVEELNFNPGTINLYYSPEHLYVRNGDYSHYPSINNNTAFGNAYNGPGRLKIYVGNATSDNGECKFNIYFCPRPAIAKSKVNSTISIFKIFRDLEIYDMPQLYYYIKDFSKDNTYNNMAGYSKGVYYWNSYDVKLDGDYRVETIINAIKAGLYFNVRSRNYFFAHPHWDILRNSAIDKSTECWNTAFENYLKSSSEYERARSIRFNCGSDDICSGDLRVKIAIRKDYRTDMDIDADDKNDKTTYISGVISFCDDSSSSIPACGNDEIELGEQCEPPLVINSIHCDQAWASCNYGNRRYGTRDGFGDCDNNCQCIEDSWNWGVVDGADYCANCPNHCGDKAQNCGEECDPGASPTGCDLGESCKADCTCGVLGTWPESHDLLTENAKIGTIEYGALIISVLLTENIDASGVDIVWYDLSNLLGSPLHRIDKNIKEEGVQSINSTLDYIAFTFINNADPVTLSSINIDQFKNVKFFLMLNSSYFDTIFDDIYLQFEDINNKQANISLGYADKNIWNSYIISLTDSNWQVDSGFDRTKVSLVRIGNIKGSHWIGDYAWLDDFYFTN
jgi:hypothetical protein